MRRTDRPDARDLLLVDGYNVIGRHAPYRERFEDDPDVGRAALVEDVGAYAAGRFEAVVVFDGRANPSSDGAPHTVAGVTVVFSPYGREADEVIEARAHRALSLGRNVRLVTSDAETQRVVARPGVTRWPVGDFVADVRAEAIERSERGRAETRSRLEDRVDPATKEALMRWARGM